MCAGRTAVHLPPWAVVGPTVSPWWALPGPVPIFLECRVLSYFGPRDVPWILPALGLLGLLCYSLHLAWFQIMPFSNKLGLNHANLQSQLNKAKTEHNRRNTCINHKLMQINPKLQAKNIKNTHAYLHLSNSPMLSLLLVLKQNTKQNKKGNASMGFKLHLPP